MNLFIWGFSAGPADIRPYITLFSSTVLFSVASGLSLFYPKPASIIGLTCLIGCSFFGAYLLKEIGWSSKIFSSIVITVFILYVVGIIYSVKNIINYSKPVEITSLRKSVKLIFAFIPIALILFWVVMVFFRF